MSPEQWAAAVERLVAQAEAQGLPRHVEDRVVVHKLVTLLRAAPAPTRRSRPVDAGPTPTDAGFLSQRSS